MVSQIAVNGEERISMKELAAYVEQDDALLGVLTVQETITFAARLRWRLHSPLIVRVYPLILTLIRSLDPSTPKQVIHERVERVITELGLTDVRRNRIGNVIQRGISGGQKRRVTLGAGLVTMPKILLLDEPTSGLDSRASYEVLQAGTFRSFRTVLFRLDNLQEEASSCRITPLQYANNINFKFIIL